MFIGPILWSLCSNILLCTGFLIYSHNYHYQPVLLVKHIAGNIYLLSGRRSPEPFPPQNYKKRQPLHCPNEIPPYHTLQWRLVSLYFYFFRPRVLEENQNQISQLVLVSLHGTHYSKISQPNRNQCVPLVHKNLLEIRRIGSSTIIYSFIILYTRDEKLGKKERCLINVLCIRRWF